MISKRTLLALAVAAMAAPALAQAPAVTPPPATDPAAPPATAASTNPFVLIHTTEGDITLELYADKAPVTVRNYLRYVDGKLFDNSTFYRASKPPGVTGNTYGSIQGGMQSDPRKLPPIAHESTIKTGILHKDGVISMGRYAPGTAQADWFILVGDMPYLDADPKDPAGNPGFAAFGHVAAGMEVVKAILGKPTDPNKGTGAMKGEILVQPVKILSVRRTAAIVPPPPPPPPPPPRVIPGIVL
jgi:peptidyl-prolyl cis-trans isomerase A (cyclophilin A)